MVSSPVPHPSRPRRLVVLVSGSGSNLQAVLDAAHDGRLNADVVGVVSDRPDAYGLERARRAGVPTEVVVPEPAQDRTAYDAALADTVAAHRPDLVVLAGWMRLLSMAFLARFPDRVINLHPALPGELPGTRAIERAWEQACEGHRDHSGVMVHRVPDEGVDDGPVLATAHVPIDPHGTFEDFARAMHRTEHDLLVRTLASECDARSPTPSPT